MKRILPERDQISMRILKTFQSLGPGLLYAGAAVGVSHLVQSTQAGAGYGLSLIWVIVLANIIKYPFFEFGPRYATATGDSLIEGYRKNLWGIPLVAFVLMTLGTMFIIQAAVTIVTSGLATYLLSYSGLDTLMLGDFDFGRILWGKQVVEGELVLSPTHLSARLLSLCALVLAFGKYKLLDKLMKVIVLLLTVTTVAALTIALFRDGVDTGPAFDWGDKALIAAVIIPLVGWMPAPLDIAVWHSIWTLEKKKQTGEELSMKSSLLDFKIGYWGTTLLAIFFLSLGAVVMYGSPEPIAKGAAAFARQLIDMYASVLGEWSRPVIGFAAFTTMLSTTLTCLDAFTRVLQRCSELLYSPEGKFRKYNGWYWIWIGAMVVGTSVLLYGFLKDMKQMVDLATTISFVTAPVLATFSYVAMTSDLVPQEKRPKGLLNAMAIFGLIFLYLFAGFYLYMLTF